MLQIRWFAPGTLTTNRIIDGIFENPKDLDGVREATTSRMATRLSHP
jgi:hypothetical protein